MSSNSGKQYGLIVPQPAAKKTNVFGDDSESDDDQGGDWMKKALKREAAKGVQKRATKLQMKQALEEDPTVFQYDEVYDEMEQKKSESKTSQKSVEKKPKYIQHLMKTAEQRKRESERRIERQVQKEREEEGSQFVDKESFVTSSYRQKLEEFKKQDEEERRLDRLEAIADVSKQKDLTGFYRHLYRQTMGETLPGADAKIEVKSEDDGDKSSKEESQVKKPPKPKDRNYRKRKTSSGNTSNESENEDTEKKRKLSNDIDADSDFSDDSSSSSSGSSVSSSEKKEDKAKEKQSDEKAPDDAPVKNEDENKDSSKELSEKKNPDKVVTENEEKETQVSKPKINIWAKRTVGVVFEQALQRYFARKASRGHGIS